MAFPVRLPVLAEVDGETVSLSAGTDPLAILEALSHSSWADLFDLIDADRGLTSRLVDHRDRFGMAQARQLAVAVAEQLTGYPWHTACSLAASAALSWGEFDGLCAWRGFDPWSAPVARTLAMVHHCLSAACKDEVERAFLDYQLAGPEAETAAGPVAELESSTFAEWSAAFGPDGSMRA